jgi:hypothetical protein
LLQRIAFSISANMAGSSSLDELNRGAIAMILQVSIAYSSMGPEDVDMPSRDWWVFPRQHLDWDAIQNGIWQQEPSLLDRKWIQYYKMPYSRYLELVEELTPYIKREDTNYREAIAPKKVVAAVLFRLSRGHQDADVANRFGLGKKTVSYYTKAVCAALSGPLFPNYISTPEGERLRSTLDSFKTVCKISNFAGAIDGSHIKLSRKPRRVAISGDYWSRHDFFSVLLQGICDAKKMFWDVCIKALGGTHDATHLRDSDLWSRLKGGVEILQEPALTIIGVLVKPYIVGDSAYPISGQLLKPFNAKARGTAEQNAFDKELRKGRVTIENAFGMLKGRWQILKNLNVEVSSAADVIVACCVLHNICTAAGVESPESEDPHPNDEEENVLEWQGDQTEAAARSRCRQIREALLQDYVTRCLT